MTLQFQPEFEKKFVSFDNIKVFIRNSKNSVCLSVSHSIMDFLFFHLSILVYIYVLLQERGENTAIASILVAVTPAIADFLQNSVSCIW